MSSIIIRDSAGDHIVDSQIFAYEKILQDSIAKTPRVIPLNSVSDEEIVQITLGTEWPAGSGSVDILLLGSDAVLTVVETKLKRNPEARREVIAQVLEYAAYLCDWSVEAIAERAEPYLREKEEKDSFDKAINDLLLLKGEKTVESFKNDMASNLSQGRIRLIVAVDEVGENAQKIVTFINGHSQFDLYLLQVSSFEDKDKDGKDREILIPSLYGFAPKTPSRPPRLPSPREWEDYIKLGLLPDQVTKIREQFEKLERVAEEWQPERRMRSSYVALHILGRDLIGVQVTKARGLEIFFATGGNQRTFQAIRLPEGVTTYLMKGFICLGGSLEKIEEDVLHRFCELAISELTSAKTSV